jgi:thioester reductase-like protein
LNQQKIKNIDDRSSFPASIFLTGGTGVLGANLLKQILSVTDATVYCLVRAESQEIATQRLHSFLKVYAPGGELNAAFAARVVAVPGEVAAPHFGMAENSWRELAAKIEVVIHAAAITNLFLTMRRIEPTNVGGTRNMIEFALATKGKYLCYVSTYTVMGDKSFDPQFVFREDQLDVGQGFSFMTYQQTKFTAENMVREAGQRGLRWNIFRPGQIFGESSTGNYPHGQANIIGLFYDIFKTVIETGIAIQSETPFDVVPVDYVAQGILLLALDTKRYFETFHLTNPDSRTYSEIINMVRRMGYAIRDVPQSDYRRMILDGRFIYQGKPYKSATLSAFKWWYKREIFDFSKGASTDASRASAALAECGVTCPRLDSKLIETYLNAGIRVGYFPKPHENLETHSEIAIST